MDKLKNYSLGEIGNISVSGGGEYDKTFQKLKKKEEEKQNKIKIDDEKKQQIAVPKPPVPPENTDEKRALNEDLILKENLTRMSDNWNDVLVNENGLFPNDKNLINLKNFRSNPLIWMRETFTNELNKNKGKLEGKSGKEKAEVEKRIKTYQDLIDNIQTAIQKDIPFDFTQYPPIVENIKKRSREYKDDWETVKKRIHPGSIVTIYNDGKSEVYTIVKMGGGEVHMEGMYGPAKKSYTLDQLEDLLRDEDKAKILGIKYAGKSKSRADVPKLDVLSPVDMPAIDTIPTPPIVDTTPAATSMSALATAPVGEIDNIDQPDDKDKNDRPKIKKYTTAEEVEEELGYIHPRAIKNLMGVTVSEAEALYKDWKERQKKQSELDSLKNKKENQDEGDQYKTETVENNEPVVEKKEGGNEAIDWVIAELEKELRDREEALQRSIAQSEKKNKKERKRMIQKVETTPKVVNDYGDGGPLHDKGMKPIGIINIRKNIEGKPVFAVLLDPDTRYPIAEKPYEEFAKIKNEELLRFFGFPEKGKDLE